MGGPDSKTFIANEDAGFIVVVIDKRSDHWVLFKDIAFAIWKPCGGDWWYRIGPADPDRGQERHIHIARKKHKNVKHKQVSWNESGPRHDKNSFYENMPGIEKARKIAREKLGLPDNVTLSWKASGGEVINEDLMSSEPFQCIVFGLEG